MTESDGSDYEEAVDVLDGKPTASDIDLQRTQLNEKCSAVFAYLLSSRETVDKRRLIENTLTDLMTAYNNMAATYLSVAAASQVACSLKTAFRKSIKEEVSVAVKRALSSLSPPIVAPGLSYADMAMKSTAKLDTRKVRITNGPTVTVPSTVSVVIGPKTANDAKYISADETRKAVIKAIKPSDVDMRVNKVVNIRNKSVRIIADSIDLPKLKESSALAAAGLEVKDREKLNPRLVIRDVPTECSNADLVTDIIALNCDNPSPGSVKVVFRYQSRLKNGLASVVIETTADVRRKLLQQGRVFLPWNSCKVEDYLRVLQCYKCYGFGHLAKDCAAATICGKCSSAHETSSCTLGVESLKCINCVTNKLANTCHSAFDASKCPVIKRRLTEKAKNISY